MATSLIQRLQYAALREVGAGRSEAAIAVGISYMTARRLDAQRRTTTDEQKDDR